MSFTLHNWLIPSLSCVDTLHIYIACKTLQPAGSHSLLSSVTGVLCTVPCTALYRRRCAKGRLKAGVSWDMFRTGQGQSDNSIYSVIRNLCVRIRDVDGDLTWGDHIYNNLRKSWPPPHVTRVRIIWSFFISDKVRQICWRQLLFCTLIQRQEPQNMVKLPSGLRSEFLLVQGSFMNLCFAEGTS